VPQFKDGLIPWIEVMRHPDGTQFGENFANLFAADILPE